jgi:predicted DNA-binding transcriptional regulator AlpA
MSSPSLMTIPAFAAEHSISRSLLYRLIREGRGPRLTKIARRTLISFESGREWREQMERETKQPGTKH